MTRPIEDDLVDAADALGPHWVFTKQGVLVSGPPGIDPWSIWRPAPSGDRELLERAHTVKVVCGELPPQMWYECFQLSSQSEEFLSLLTLIQTRPEEPREIK